MFEFMAPFAAACIGIESLFAIFVVAAQFISRRGSL